MSAFSELIFQRTYAFTPGETWEQCSRRVSYFVAQAAPTEQAKRELEQLFYKVISTKKFIPGGRYLYSAGRKIQQIANCFLFRAEDSREGWGRLVDRHVNCLATGGGCGTEYSVVRVSGTSIKGYGGTASGPISLMMMVNEVARHVLAGGKRRSALWAGLNWQHGDIEQFITIKNWSTQIRACKEADFNFPAPLDMTNISVGLDDEFFAKVHMDPKVWDLYYRICKSMCKTGEPGFSVNIGDKRHESLRNACCEVTSEFDSDTCNLGSVNLSRIEDIDELREITLIATLFLYCGTFLGWTPHQDFADVRDRIRRIGVGLMGVHEWCLKNDLPYGPSDKLARWLSVWKEATERQSRDLVICFGPDAIEPIALRAIAPTGTIGIIGETTTGIEPIYCVAYKRRFLNGLDGRWKYSYVIDPTAERLIKQGIKPDAIEDAYKLAHDFERRIQMQAFIQGYVDQSISSTINLPAWGEPGNNNAKHFAQTLLKYLPQLRGITTYPDSSRSGQPITPIDYADAVKHKDVVFEESGDRCIGGSCGI
jgi:ribonucleoside-diphosphate reductase alpha chain